MSREGCTQHRVGQAFGVGLSRILRKNIIDPLISIEELILWKIKKGEVEKYCIP